MSGDHDRGGVTAELAVLTPALVLCMLFVVLAGRLGQAEHDVTHAAAEAARTASIVRSGDAAASAVATAERNLTAAGVRCRRLSVDLSGSDWRPGGTAAVEVRCEVDLTDVAWMGLPGGRAVSARAVEVIDTYRGIGRGFGTSEGADGTNSGVGGG